MFKHVIPVEKVGADFVCPDGYADYNELSMVCDIKGDEYMGCACPNGIHTACFCSALGLNAEGEYEWICEKCIRNIVAIQGERERYYIVCCDDGTYIPHQGNNLQEEAIGAVKSGNYPRAGMFIGTMKTEIGIQGPVSVLKWMKIEI